ncbi:MAG: hypothetical protein M1838_004392 [Thelocarpon superellum]|nr:MAG: hypothetical protein M1838_004392 [Thelocarpon superellum]
MDPHASTSERHASTESRSAPPIDTTPSATPPDPSGGGSGMSPLRSYLAEAAGDDQSSLWEPVNRRHATTSWTSVTEDRVLIDHLLGLYFCWEYPIFSTLSKEHFMHDLAQGGTKYCSALLVNAILALGCRFSDRPEARADAAYGATTGDHFFREARRLLTQEFQPTLTTVQALGLMSIREASCGRDGAGYLFSIRSMGMALELGLHLSGGTTAPGTPSAIELDARSVTFWGCFNLHHAWSLWAGRLPQVVRAAIGVRKPFLVAEREHELWTPYVGEGEQPQSGFQQRSHVRSVQICLCQLSELINETLFALYASDQPVTGRELVRHYTRRLEWHGALPEALRLGENSTPSVLTVHMYYHLSILLLFRPFLSFNIRHSTISPRVACAEAASSISSVLSTYRSLYTFRRVPFIVPHIVLGATIVRLLDPGATEAPAALVQGVEALTEIRACDVFADYALDVFHFHAQRLGLAVVRRAKGLILISLPPQPRAPFGDPRARSMLAMARDASGAADDGAAGRWGFTSAAPLFSPCTHQSVPLSFPVPTLRKTAVDGADPGGWTTESMLSNGFELAFSRRDEDDDDDDDNDDSDMEDVS